MQLRYGSFLQRADRGDKVYEGCAGAGANAVLLAVGLDIR
jgi:hypothetical protein